MPQRNSTFSYGNLQHSRWNNNGKKREKVVLGWVKWRVIKQYTILLTLQDSNIDMLVDGRIVE
jgi:hypothetical protein